VLQEFVNKYKTPEEVQRHADEAIVSYRYFEEAIKKVKASKEGKPVEKVTVPYYR
jgi:transitional endoplasmic reticulum ATPase